MSTRKLVRQLYAMAEAEGCTVRRSECRVARHIRLAVRDRDGREYRITVAGSPVSLDGAVLHARAELRAARRHRDEGRNED